MVTKIVIFVGLLAVSLLAFFADVFLSTEMAVKLFWSAISITILYGIFAVGIYELGIDKVPDKKARYSIRKAARLTWNVLLVVVLLWIWVPNPQALVVAYGVVAAGIAFALQDVIKNFAGGFIIFLGSQYRVGDRVEIKGVCGDVIDIGLFSTRLLEIQGWVAADQATGRIVTVPNGVVLNNPVHNYTHQHEFIWDELAVVVTAESDWSEAMRLLVDIATEHTKEYAGVAEKSLGNLQQQYYIDGRETHPRVFIANHDHGYQLVVRYVVDARARRVVNSNIWGHIIRVFSEHSAIAIAPSSFASVPYPIVESR